MYLQDVIQDNKWSILKELSKGKKSASEVAKKIGTTTANTTNLLKLMEAQGLVKPAKASNDKEVIKQKAGKPKKRFELHDKIIIACAVGKGISERRISKAKDLSEFERFMLTALIIMEPELAYALAKFCLEANLLKKADLISLHKAEGNEIEIFIVAEQHLNEIRDKYSNANIECQAGKTKKIISWSHNKKEVEEGLERKEEYFQNLVLGTELLDKKSYLKEWAE